MIRSEQGMRESTNKTTRFSALRMRLRGSRGYQKENAEGQFEPVGLTSQALGRSAVHPPGKMRSVCLDMGHTEAFFWE
jgi:hypothetical protein